MSFRQLGIASNIEAARKEPLLSVKEKFWLGVGCVATVAAGLGIWEMADAQEDGIRNSLAAEAQVYIPAFARIAKGGDTPQTILDEVRSATVELSDGSRCHIQYETYGVGILGSLFENRARIVSPGTCPVSPN